VLVVWDILREGKGPTRRGTLMVHDALFCHLPVHMPFFMFLSGFIFLHLQTDRRCGDYGRYVVASPCVSGQHICCLAGLMIAGKVIAQRFLM